MHMSVRMSASTFAPHVCMHVQVHVYAHGDTHGWIFSHTYLCTGRGVAPVYRAAATDVSTKMSTHMSMHMSTRMAVRMPVHMLVHMSVCMSIHMYCTCPYACLYTCMPQSMPNQFVRLLLLDGQANRPEVRYSYGLYIYGLVLDGQASRAEVPDTRHHHTPHAASRLTPQAYISHRPAGGKTHPKQSGDRRCLGAAAWQVIDGAFGLLLDRKAEYVVLELAPCKYHRIPLFRASLSYRLPCDI